MIKKHLVALTAVLLSCVAFSGVETVQVIQALPTSPKSDGAGTAFGKGLGEGLSKGTEAAAPQGTRFTIVEPTREEHSYCDLTPEKEKEAHQLFDEFVHHHCSDWDEFQKVKDDFFKKFGELMKDVDPDLVSSWFEKGGGIDSTTIKSFKNMLSSLRDSRLKSKGILAWGNPGFYWVRFETNQKSFSLLSFKRTRILSFKISEDIQTVGLGLLSPKIENAQLILKNDEGFEFARVNVGTIEPYNAVTTGQIEVSEEDYQKLSKVDLKQSS